MVNLFFLLVLIAIVQPHFLDRDIDLDENILQNNRQNMDVHIYLHTRYNTKNPDKLDIFDLEQTIRKSNFTSREPIRIYINNYGLVGSQDFLSIRNAYLSQGNFNFITVNMDTKNEESSIPYLELIATTSAQLIMLLKKFYGLDTKAMTVIGYGTGAHAAGLTGRLLKYFDTPTLGYIVAIDPYFNVTGNMRLNKRDAIFVQSIKTSPLGTSEDVGEVNFLVNYGMEQPGCGDDHTHCTHPRGHVIFAESLISKTGFWALKCRTTAEIYNRTCGGNLELCRMGGEPLEPNGRGYYYVPTNEVPPYAVGPFPQLS